MSNPVQEIRPRDRLLRRQEVELLSGLSRSSIYERIRSDPDWPKPVRLGANSVAWLESEIHAWIARQVAASRRVAS